MQDNAQQSEPTTARRKETTALRMLKIIASIDWKAMLLVLTALGGVFGAVWNKIEGYLLQRQSAKTQIATYELLAQRMDELFSRVEFLEDTCKRTTQKEQTRAEKTTAVRASVSAASELKELPIIVETPQEEVRRQIQFRRARLPEFQLLQRAAPSEIDTLMAPPDNESPR